MAQFVNDTFTSSTTQDLPAHTGEVGASWTKHGLFAYSTRVNSSLDNLGCSSVGSACDYASGTPAGAEYDISADLTIYSGASGIGVAGRVDASATTMYWVRCYPGAIQLYKYVDDTATLLGSYGSGLTGTHTIKLEIRDAAKKVYYDGAEVISSADNAITASGVVGVRSVGTNSTPRLDNFTADDAAGGGTFKPFWAKNATQIIQGARA